MFHLVKLEKADFYLSEHSAFNQNIQMDRRVQLYSLQKHQQSTPKSKKTLVVIAP